MGMTWTERLSKVVLPALVDGLHIYTGYGELHPGPGIVDKNLTPEAVKAKPVGLPGWQVYQMESANRPAHRFMQFIHAVRNPTGGALAIYPSEKNLGVRGIHLILPLGEGLETPSYELNLARDLQALIMFKPVKVIAIGRHRPFGPAGRWEVSEHLLMEVYSDNGDLIWSNPYIGMTLEEAIDKVRNAEVFRTKGAPEAPMAAPQDSTVPFQTPAQGPTEASQQVVQDKRQQVEGTIRQVYGQGMTDGEIKAHVARTHGFDIKVASRLVEDFKKRNEPTQEIQKLVRGFAAQYDGLGYEGDDLFEVVAEDSGVGLDMVRRVLQLPVPVPRLIPAQASVPSPALPGAEAAASPKAPTHAAPASSDAVLDTLGLGRQDFSIEVEGLVRDKAQLPKIERPKAQRAKTDDGDKPKAPAKPRSHTTSEDDLVGTIIRDIHERTDHMQRQVLEHLGTTHKAQASALRVALGIQSGSTGPLKQVSDHFRRTILDPLERLGCIACEGSGRVAAYRLVK
jgi:hypothetical protein